MTIINDFTSSFEDQKQTYVCKNILFNKIKESKRIMIAYVLANVIPGYEKDAIAEIRNIPEAKEVNGIMGRYDVFIKMSSTEPLKLDAAIGKIRRVKHVTETLTMNAIYGQGGTIDDSKE